MSKLIDLGGGWYERPDGEKVQLKADDVEAYEASLEEVAAPDEKVAPVEAAPVENVEVVEAPDRPVDPLDSLPSPPPTSFPSGIDEGALSGVQVNVRDLPPVPGSQFPIGPFNDYAFVTTPWGEFAIPKGQHIVGVKEIPDVKDPGKISYRAIYGGTQYARSRQEREDWLRLTEAERRGEQT